MCLSCYDLRIFSENILRSMFMASHNALIITSFYVLFLHQRLIVLTQEIFLPACSISSILLTSVKITLKE